MANDKKKSNFSIRKLIYNDRSLIIFVLVLAVLIWIVTSLNIGTDETKTIKVDVPISLGDEVSDQLGMQYYSLQDTIEVSVTISGAKYVIGQVSQSDLTVKFDTSSVNRTGVQTVPILVSNNSRTLDFDITSTYPSSIEAYYDVNETKTFDLNLNYDKDNLAKGYIFGDAVLSEDEVLISGPKTYVDKVDSASLNVDFGDSKNLTEPFNVDCKIEIEGTGAETNYLTITSRDDIETALNSVSVTLPVLKVTSLPVSANFDDAPSALPSDAVTVSYSVGTLDAGVLDSANISNAVIGNISYNKIKTGTNKFSFDVTSLQGITVLNKNVKKITATVKVSDDYTSQTISVKKENIIVEGVPDGYTANVKSISSSNVTAITPSTTTISASSIELKCDVTEQAEDNVYNVSVKLTDNKDSWVYGTYTAVIELVQKQ